MCRFFLVVIYREFSDRRKKKVPPERRRYTAEKVQAPMSAKLVSVLFDFVGTGCCCIFVVTLEVGGQLWYFWSRTTPETARMSTAATPWIHAQASKPPLSSVVRSEVGSWSLASSSAMIQKVKASREYTEKKKKSPLVRLSSFEVQVCLMSHPRHRIPIKAAATQTANSDRYTQPRKRNRRLFDSSYSHPMIEFNFLFFFCLSPALFFFLMAIHKPFSLNREAQPSPQKKSLRVVTSTFFFFFLVLSPRLTPFDFDVFSFGIRNFQIIFFLFSQRGRVIMAKKKDKLQRNQKVQQLKFFFFFTFVEFIGLVLFLFKTINKKQTARKKKERGGITKQNKDKKTKKTEGHDKYGKT